MATSAGRTRTVIALCDLLMRCNWVKRVLFLADRVALVGQAVNAFKKFLPQSSPVNLVTEKETDGRVMVSTYSTMMGLIEEFDGTQRRFGVGHFDLIVINEAPPFRFTKNTAPSSATSTRCSSASPRRHARKWIATPTASSTSKKACPPTPTI